MESSFAYKLVCIDDKFTKPIVVFRGANAAHEFIKEILKEYQYCKKKINKYFNKNLIMTEEEEKQFQSSNTCWICEKLIENDVEKTRKVKDAAHWSCIINLHLSKTVSVIFHNLRK